MKMKNKKTIIILILLVLVIVAVVFGIFNATHNDNYLYNENGTITDGKSELINHLKSIEDVNERKNQIDFSVKQNIITQQEANELYQNKKLQLVLIIENNFNFFRSVYKLLVFLNLSLKINLYIKIREKGRGRAIFRKYKIKINYIFQNFKKYKIEQGELKKFLILKIKN